MGNIKTGLVVLGMRNHADKLMIRSLMEMVYVVFTSLPAAAWLIRFLFSGGGH